MQSRLGRLAPTFVALALAAAALAVVAPASATPAARALTGRCTGRSSVAPGNITGHINHVGLDRTFVLHVPTGYDRTVRTPVVLLFHGQGSYGAQQLIYSGYGTLADREHFLVVAPDSTGAVSHYQWVVPTSPLSPHVDDVGFVAALLDRLKANFCVDEDRVFATGISSGAFMVSYLACRIPGRIASAVTVAGTFFFDTPDCHHGRPVPVLAFHGSADTHVPYHHEVGGTSPGVVAETQSWAVRNGCATTSTIFQLAPHIFRRSWDCAPDQTARLVRIEGGGHTWPGSIFDVPPLGVTTREVSATTKGWRFFESHPRT